MLKNTAVQLFGHRTAGAQDYVFKCKVWSIALYGIFIFMNCFRIFIKHMPFATPSQKLELR